MGFYLGDLKKIAHKTETITWAFNIKNFVPLRVKDLYAQYSTKKKKFNLNLPKF